MPIPFQMEKNTVGLTIIGAMKCGTTTLADLLARHPDVCFCSNKEPDFFSKSPDWRNSLDEYHALFNDRTKLMAEASTSYTFYPHFNLRIWADMYSYNPGMKLIYLYREPVSRCVSHYMHVYERGYLDMSLTEAIRRVPIIVNNSRFAAQVKPFIEQFSKEQVLLMDLDLLAKNRSAAIQQVARFTGLDPAGFPEESESHKNSSVGESKHHHKYDDPGLFLRTAMKITPRGLRPKLWRAATGTGKRGFNSKPVLTGEWKEAIIRLLESDILDLERLTNRSLDHWFENNGVERSR
jgi:hypothetical protein